MDDDKYNVVDLGVQVARMVERLEGLRAEVTLRVAACERTELVLIERLKQERGLADERRATDHGQLELQRTLDQTKLELQAKEYDKHFEKLNGAHEEAMENWSHSLPRESFIAFEKEFRSWKDKEFQVWKDEVNSNMTATMKWTAFGALVWIAIQIIFFYLKR